MAIYSDQPQVVTFHPDGTDARWLGFAAHFGALNYGYAMPGGASQLSGVIQVSATNRLQAMDAGRIVKVYRGALEVWDGKLDEAAMGDSGYAISAHGAGTFGDDFDAYYTGTYTADNPVNAAIARTPFGLRWVNPGIGSGSDIFIPSIPDPASITITDHLNQITSPAGSVWYVGRNNILSVYTPSWKVPNRILVSTSPPSRSLYGYPTVIWIRYQITSDTATTGVAATYGTTSVTNNLNAGKHGNQEFYIDLSAAGNMTAGGAQAVAQAVIGKYIAAAFGGPFQVRYGQLLNMGGTPVDLANEQAGTVCQLMFAAGGYGGEVVPALPVTFLVGDYTYDYTTQIATISPYQLANFDLPTLLGDWVTIHTPKATVAATGG
jgi:hypothetical protein